MHLQEGDQVPPLGALGRGGLEAAEELREESGVLVQRHEHLEGREGTGTHRRRLSTPAAGAPATRHPRRGLRGHGAGCCMLSAAPGGAAPRRPARPEDSRTSTLLNSMRLDSVAKVASSSTRGSTTSLTYPRRYDWWILARTEALPMGTTSLNTAWEGQAPGWPVRLCVCAGVGAGAGVFVGRGVPNGSVVCWVE